MGGIGTNTAAVAPALARRGHDVCVVTRGETSHDVEDGVTVVRIDHRWLPHRSSQHLLALRRIAAAALRFRPDVAQAAEWEAEGWWLARWHSVPLVTRLATPSYVLDELNRRPLDDRARLVRRLERDQTRRSAAVFAPTRAIIDKVARDWGLDASRMEQIPNAVRIATIREAGAEEPEQDLPERFLVFFGRLERRKGIEVLAAALPRVLESNPGLEAVFVGRDPGDEDGALMERFRGLVEPVADRVHLLGELPRRQALAVVARAELAVFPSLWESFGYVAVEAMALSRPVVASKAGGFPEFIEDGRTGWLVPPGDADALAESLLARLRDRDELHRVGEAANAAADRFDVDRIVGELEGLYERVLTGPSRQGFDSSIYRSGYRRYFKADDTRDPFHRLYEQKRLAVLRGFADHEGLTIVDVGGGYGRLAGPLARTHSVTLVDISPEMLEEARSSLPPEVTLVQADARQLPFEAGEFDAALALDLLVHVPDLDTGVRELARVVRPGGRLVFDTTNAVPLWVLAYPSYVHWRPRRLLRTLLSRGVLPEWRQIVRHDRAEEVRRAIAAAGLRLERSQGFGPPGLPKWHLWWTTKP